MTSFKRSRKVEWQSACLFALLMFISSLVACAGASTPNAGLPGSSNIGTANTYTGKLGTSPSQTDTQLWSVVIDHDQGTFSYSAPATSGNGAVSAKGTFTSVNGFLLLLDQNGYQLGYGIEVPGQMTILRPGNSSTQPIFSIQQSSCFPIVGNDVKFQFVLVPGSTTEGQAAFGKVYAGTNSSGTLWTFDGQALYQAPGASTLTNAYIPGYPTSYSGVCNSSPSSTSIQVSQSQAYSVPTQYMINPSGFFLEDQNFNGSSQFSSLNLGDIPSIGVAEPSAPVTTATVSSATYRGFLFAANNGTYQTQPVGFGGITSKSSINGGTFPSEDVTQSSNTNMTISFGQQDTLNNGLYYLAKFTLPIGPSESCSAPSTDPNGNTICTYSAAAIVGNPSGKYVIFLTAFTGSGYQKLLVLFQQ
jgi:hypothetical protein